MHLKASPDGVADAVIEARNRVSYWQEQWAFEDSALTRRPPTWLTP